MVCQNQVPKHQRANAPWSKWPQRAAGISQKDFQDLLCQSAKRKILWILLVMILGWVIKENLIQSLKWRIKTHSKGEKPGQNQCGLQSWLDPRSLAVLSISAPQHFSPAPALFAGSSPVGKLQTTLSEEKGTSLSQLFSRCSIDEVSQTLSTSSNLPLKGWEGGGGSVWVHLQHSHCEPRVEASLTSHEKTYLDLGLKSIPPSLPSEYLRFLKCRRLE